MQEDPKNIKKLNTNTDESPEVAKDNQTSQKGFVENIGAAVSGLFSKESPKHFQKILEDPTSPAYQKNLAIQGIVLKKIKTLNLTLINLIKGDYGATPDVRSASANALTKIGGFYSLDIPSVLLIDLMELYMSTADIKLYEALKKLFLSEELFPYYKFTVRTLASRFGISGEVNSLVWEVYSRILSLCFEFRYMETEQSLRAELKAMKPSSDRQKFKLEQSIYYIKYLINLAEEVRDTLCTSLAKEKEMEQTIEVMRYPSLTASYHEKCKFNKLLEPIMGSLIDDKAEIRSFVMTELYEINTPCAYDFYRSVILNKIQPYPDVAQNLLQLMAKLSLTDGACLDTFISFITTPPNTTGELFFNELEQLCHQNEEIHYKIILIAKGYIDIGDCPEFSIHQLLSKIFPIKISKDTLDFIINMALGKIRLSIASGAKAARVLTSLNDSSFKYADDVFRTIEFIMTSSGPHEIKDSIFRGIKQNPTRQNIVCLGKAVFDIDKESSLTAMKTYLEIAKSGGIEDELLKIFYLKLCSTETVTPESAVLAIDFLKASEQIDLSIKKATSKFLYSKSPEIRRTSFELYCIWFANIEDEEELLHYLSLFTNIISETKYTYLDTYKKIVNLLADFLSSKESDTSQYAENIFTTIRTTLDSSISSEHKTILCGLLEYTAENAQPKICLQAEWHMDTIIKSPYISHSVALCLLKTMILKQKKLIPCTRSIVKLLSESQPSEFRASILEIFIAGINTLPKYNNEEKVSAYNQKEPKDIYNFVQWEISINKELLPVILAILSKEFSDFKLIGVAMSVMKFLIYARSYANLLFEFKDYPADETIRIRAIESVSSLLFPDFTIPEKNILNQFSVIAANKSLLPVIRQNAIKAIGKICDIEQFETITTILSDHTEKEEVLLACVKSINKFKTPFANTIYADILSNPNFPKSIIEAILSGISDFADSRILDSVIKLMQGSSEKTTKLCIELLNTSGYKEIVEIHNLYKEVESLEKSIDNLHDYSKSAKEKLAQYPAQLSVLVNDRDVLQSKLNSAQQSISAEEEIISSLNYNFEVSQEHIYSKIKEFMPNWPNDKRPPADKKELFMDYQEQLREEKDNYNLAVEESNKKIAHYTKDKDATGEFLSEMNSHIDYLNKNKTEAEETIEKYETETPKLKERIAKISAEAKNREQIFSESVPAIDEENHDRLIANFEARENDWNERKAYYKIIAKNVQN